MKKITLLTLCTAMFSVLGYAQTDIADARTFSIGATVTVTGIVTNGSELGGIKYMEDGTAGIAVYSPSLLSSINRGDSITVTGTLKDYNNLLEIDPVATYAINSTGNTLPTPQVITPNGQDETTESELVEIDNAVFSSGGGTFSGNTNYSFTSSSQTGDVRINSSSNLVGTIIPVGAVNIVAIVSQYSTSYQLLVRDLNDIVMLGALYMTSSLDVSNITTTSLDLAWTTNAASNTNVKYGLTASFELGEFNDVASASSHSISMTGLTPATIYYALAYSVSGTDTAFSSTKMVATESNSTGEIITYFNNTVDTTVSQGTYATYVADFPDTIIAYINKATTTLDICVYNNNNLNLVTAINNAYSNGVTVRYVTTLTTLNSALSSLDPGITVHKGNSDGIMHNKFMVVDRDDVNNSWVLTGSTNWTTNNLSQDYNNMLLIQDQTVAKAYTLEFEEFWGGTGAAPNVVNSKFGSEKTDNTPHEFVVGGNPLEVYFSPSDLTTSKIQAGIESSSSSLEFALLSFTKNELGTAVKDANDNHGNVRGIMESINDQGEEFTFLTGAGVDLLSHQGVQYDMHHKYAIIDQVNPGSDPFVLTGSHNWSTAAETRNDENTVFVHNADIANQYHQEFMARYCELATCAPTVAPVASFTATYNGSGFTSFADMSAYQPSTWLWNFGDGNSSTEQNPTHTYAILDSSYYVCLTVTNIIGTDMYCEFVYADTTTVLPVPVALFNFTYDGSGQTSFTDNSSNSPTSWSWDFGDGNTSTSQSPVNTYSILDVTYNVCLTATNTFGSGTYCDSVYADTTTVLIGVNELSSPSVLKVYPNPSAGEFNMSFTAKKSGEARVRVLDISGKNLYTETVAAQAGENTITINTDLSAGQYILELYIDGLASFQPIIIE